MRFFLVSCLAVFYAFAAFAQDDKTRLTRYLEDTLSGLGREVQIEGFRGALSSRATMDKLTIADAKGIWLTLNDVVLDWDRAAILGGRIEINELTAASIELARLPVSKAAISPEATPFSLPDLPVSIRIGALRADRVTIGASVLGMAATASLNGELELTAGEGRADLEIRRLDGPRGTLNLNASYANATRILSIDMALDEAAGGIVATLARLPDRPALEFAITGQAPIDDFTADIVLKSQGEDRLAGTLRTVKKNERPSTGTDADMTAAPRVIALDVSGDLAPLFAARFRPFFGTRASLAGHLSLFPDGAARLDGLNLATNTLHLAGDISVDAEGIPDRFDLVGDLRQPDGTAALLPLAGPDTLVDSASLRATYDRGKGDGWSLEAQMAGLRRDALRVGEFSLRANGTISRENAPRLTGRIDAALRQVTPSDPAVAQALGPTATFGGDIDWRKGAPAIVSGLKLVTDGLSLTGAGDITATPKGVDLQGRAHATVPDISRFSALAGRRLGGALRADLNGRGNILSGAFDLTLNGAATDLKLGIDRLDTTLAGPSTLTASARRDSDGVILRSLELKSHAAFATASGKLASGDSDILLDAKIDDLAALIGALEGPAQLTGHAVQDAAGWTVSANADAANATRLQGTAALPNTGQPTIDVTADIGAVQALVPDLVGAGHLRASARRNGENWEVTAKASGPSNSTLNAEGSLARDAKTAVLALEGRLPLALANRRISPNSLRGMAQFALRLDGPLALSSLRGSITSAGARLSLPALRNALTGIDATVTLGAQNARLQITSKVASGGNVTAEGQITTLAPYTADMAVALKNVTITDGALFETRANGALTLRGPLLKTPTLAGQVSLGQTELQVPSSTLTSLGEIPDIRHLNEPAPVRVTRERAGVSVNQGAQSARPALGLDVKVIAANRIFVRGRGLDAELGGRMTVAGTTGDVIAAGQFDLIRGRLDILGKRLELEEGSIRLKGSLTPYLRLVASTTSDDTLVRVIVEGPADAPELTFSSQPPLPGDEVVARLLFGRATSSLSPLQAVQLASAVATLAGRSGTGLIEKLRENAGIDDLDLTTNASGKTALRTGKYLSEKIYSDVIIDTEGKSQINLNLDISPATKLRGNFGSDGQTGVGVFFEKDY